MSALEGFGEFEKLARAAREDTAPDLDVVDRVMRRVRAVAPAVPASRLWPLALGVWGVAAASVLLAARSYLELHEPLVELLKSATEVFL